MSAYRVKFYSGDYSARQQAANKDGAALYFEGHANSSTNQRADYAMCVCATNASSKTIALGQRLATRWGAALDVGGDRDTDVGYGNGVRIGGAGDGNLRHTNMPAVLGEPGFASNPSQAALMESNAGLNTIAEILADEIRAFLPDGGLIGFSVGHLGKTSAPHDRGAAWNGMRYANEAEFCQAYLARTAWLLTNGKALEPIEPLTAQPPALTKPPAAQRDHEDLIITTPDGRVVGYLIPAVGTDWMLAIGGNPAASTLKEPNP